MNKEQQDLAWACLPKEARNHIRSDYEYYLKRYEAVKTNTAKGAIDALEDLFGSHNLTSDTEPEEMLFVERKRVQELYDGLLNEKKAVSISTSYGGTITARMQILQDLFGDKCLPDKEPSVQVEPKFKVGDKVRKTSWDKDTTISRVEWHGTWETFVYHFKEQEYGFNCHKENDLTLVSKRAKDPDFSIGDKVQLKFDWCRLLKGTLLTIKEIPAIDRDDTFMYSFEEIDEYIRETILEPYTELETKESDTHKALYDALCELESASAKVRESLIALNEN